MGKMNLCNRVDRNRVVQVLGTQESDIYPKTTNAKSKRTSTGTTVKSVNHTRALGNGKATMVQHNDTTSFVDV